MGGGGRKEKRSAGSRGSEEHSGSFVGQCLFVRVGGWWGVEGPCPDTVQSTGRRGGGVKGDVGDFWEEGESLLVCRRLLKLNSEGGVMSIIARSHVSRSCSRSLSLSLARSLTHRHSSQRTRRFCFDPATRTKDRRFNSSGAIFPHCSLMSISLSLTLSLFPDQQKIRPGS